MTINDLKRPQKTSKDTNKNDKPVSKKGKPKNILRGRDLNDGQNDGKNLIKQAFSSN